MATIHKKEMNYRIRFGIARCVGSIASALIALVLGHVIAALGLTWMLILLILFRMLCILLLLGYPKIAAVRSEKKTASVCTSPSSSAATAGTAPSWQACCFSACSMP